MNLMSLAIAAGVGLALQLAIVAAAHRSELVRTYLLAAGGATLSLATGIVYGKLGGDPWAVSLAGGAAAGAACALVGTLVAIALKDASVRVLAFAVLASAATGALGAAMGRLLA